MLVEARTRASRHFRQHRALYFLWAFVIVLGIAGELWHPGSTVAALRKRWTVIEWLFGDIWYVTALCALSIFVFDALFHVLAMPFKKRRQWIAVTVVDALIRSIILFAFVVVAIPIGLIVNTSGASQTVAFDWQSVHNLSPLLPLSFMSATLAWLFVLVTPAKERKRFISVLFSPVGCIWYDRRSRRANLDWESDVAPLRRYITSGSVWQEIFVWRIVRGMAQLPLTLWRSLAAKRIIWLIVACIVVISTYSYFFPRQFNLILTGNLLPDGVQLQHAEFHRFVATFLLGAPIAFALWLFRDHNVRLTLENTRKDVNLKDFQTISQQAAGLLLVEQKQTEAQKYDPSRGVVERTLTLEGADAPSANGLADLPSRRLASIAIQLAAIHQLGRFAHGDFGAAFVRPAFVLLRELWGANVNPYAQKFAVLRDVWDDNDHWLTSTELRPLASKSPMQASTERRIEIERFIALRDQTYQYVAGRIPQQIQASLNAIPDSRMAGVWGLFFSDDFRSAEMTAWRSKWIEHPIIRTLPCLAMFEDATLHLAQFDDCNLSYSYFSRVDAIGIGLANCALVGADFCDARVQCGAFNGADLSFADFTNAKCQLAFFVGSSLEDCIFKDAKLQGAHFRNISTNDSTRFDGAITSEHTRVFVGVPKAGSTIAADFPEGYDVDEAATLALRAKLREKNGLILPDAMYERI